VPKPEIKDAATGFPIAGIAKHQGFSLSAEDQLESITGGAGPIVSLILFLSWFSLIYYGHYKS